MLASIKEMYPNYMKVPRIALWIPWILSRSIIIVTQSDKDNQVIFVASVPYLYFQNAHSIIFHRFHS